MSKTYSMPGWRIGFAAGNHRLISALRGEVLFGLWCLHADPGSGGGFEWAAGLRRRDADLI